MYLHYIELQNFRSFGEMSRVYFRKGLNVLVGENDSGKSAIIDAIRIVMGTTDQSWYHIDLSDFHNEDRQCEIKINLKFVDLTLEEQAAFLECLSYENVDNKNVPCLYLHWVCRYLLNFVPPRAMTNLTTGVMGDGPVLPAAAKEFLRVTYLRPLRDAYSNMQAGRNSRLSQIVQSIPELNAGESVYVEGMDLKQLSLTGIADLSNKLLAEHPKLQKANQDISDIVTSKMLLKGDHVDTQFAVAGTNAAENKKLIALLEKLDLSAKANNGSGKVGLGTSNVLSMACELLLNRQAGSSFLLIEEPEAHVHAQRQLRLMQSLQAEANSKERSQQIIVTTHSPILASVINLENITIVKDAKAYSLQSKDTLLNASDYRFLERFLDATKANMFFAKAVIMVEGPSEELLLPTIARILDKDLTECGVSIVNVRGTGLQRYAKIFQRANSDEQLMIKVACITDRDVMPDCAPAICINAEYSDPVAWPANRKWKTESDYPQLKDKEKHLFEICNRADGQYVKTFVADHWTFEYDLAYAGLWDEIIEAIVRVNYIESTRKSKMSAIAAKLSEFSSLEQKASYLYSYFSKDIVSKAEVAQQLADILERKYAEAKDDLLAKLPAYILGAINYVTQ
ncbi:MAG: DUF2813 domain-containing protein [Clostridiales bacterium]|nr:DUF2813 domain-containing protein [Clostridiales bacterium]